VNQLFSRCFVVTCVSVAGFAHAADVVDFIDFSLRDAKNTVMLPGRLFVPPEAASDSHALRPLIVFLHGSGEAGNDNANQVNGNIDNLLAEAKRRGAFLYAPQAPGEEWRDKVLTDLVMAVVDRAIAVNNVDRNRIYVTGVSSGGGGIWNLLSRFPARFAAAVSISGDMPAPDFVAAKIIGTPICAFHSRDDDTVPVAEDRGVITGVLAAVNLAQPPYPAAGSSEYFLVSNPSLASHRAFSESVRQQQETKDFVITGTTLDLIYNELPVGGHGIWPAVYSTPAIYDWMFAHELPPARNRATASTSSAPAMNVYTKSIRSRASLRNRLRHASGIPAR
jgi:predicted peptidase